MTLVFLQYMRTIWAIFRGVTLLAASLPGFGQAGKAELSGAIQDSSGLGVPQAKVCGQERATGAQASVATDGRGEYHLLGLAAGQYVLTVEKPGFRPYRQAGIALRIGDQIRLNVKIEVGLSSQSVDVNAETSLLETASGALSYHVGQAQIETLPLDGRNFVPLVALSPGLMNFKAPPPAPRPRLGYVAFRSRPRRPGVSAFFRQPFGFPFCWAR